MQYRLLFKEDAFIPELLSDVGFAIECLVGSLGSSYLGICFRDEKTVRRCWRSDPPGAFTVDLIEDRILPAAWLAVHAESERLAVALIESLAEKLPVESLDDLRRVAAKPNSPVGSLQRLALALDDRNSEASDLALFENALRAEDSGRRTDSVMGTALWRSPALERPLARARARENDPALQKAMDYATKRLAESD